MLRMTILFRWTYSIFDLRGGKKAAFGAGGYRGPRSGWKLVQRYFSSFRIQWWTQFSLSVISFRHRWIFHFSRRFSQIFSHYFVSLLLEMGSEGIIYKETRDLTENHRIAKEMKGITPRIECRITESLQLNFSLSQLVCNLFSSCSPKRLSSMVSHAKIFIEYPIKLFPASP